jgi:hypothetical protein
MEFRRKDMRSGGEMPVLILVDLVLLMYLGNKNLGKYTISQLDLLIAANPLLTSYYACLTRNAFSSPPTHHHFSVRRLKSLSSRLRLPHHRRS